MTLFYPGGPPLQRRIKPFEWQADELLLIRSLLGRGRHEILRRWPLRPVPPAQFALF